MDRTGPGQHDHVEIRAFSCPPHNNGSPNYAAPASVNCSAPTARQLPPLGGAQPEVFQEPWHDLRSQPRVDCLRTGSSRHWWRPSPCTKPTPHRSRSLSLDWTRIELAGGPVPARFSLLPCDPDTSRIEQEKVVRSCGSGADPPSVRRWTTLKRHRQRPCAQKEEADRNTCCRGIHRSSHDHTESNPMRSASTATWRMVSREAPLPATGRSTPNLIAVISRPCRQFSSAAAQALTPLAG